MARHERDLTKERHWREVLQRQQSSGLNVRAFCKREQIAETAFHFWRRTIRERDGDVKPASPVPRFVPATITLDIASEAFALELVGDHVLRMPGPGLLASVVTRKLADHLPLYRLENIFQRQQVSIARSTMCAWMRCAGELVAPLTRLMTRRIKQSRAVHTDDTPVPIQSLGAKKCRQGRIWCYLGDEANPYTIYDYTPSRSRDGPAKWLAGYAGYLQADAYGGYDGIFHAQNVTEVACWSHARRKFYDAQDSDPKRAAEMLALIGQLYAVEREAKDLTDDARLTLRQARSVPVLGRI